MGGSANQHKKTIARHPVREGTFETFSALRLLMVITEKPLSKDALLQQVDVLRDLARRAKRMAGVLTLESDRQRLGRHAEEIDETASRLEREAAGAKAALPFDSGARLFAASTPKRQ